MSIASEITRLQNAKSALKTAIEDKGQTIPSSATIDTYPYYIDTIGGNEEKTVEFIDFDGSIVTAYTKNEFLAITQLPQNPSHSGLTSNGWNWDIVDAKDYVANYGWLTIGQLYTPSDGSTKIVVDTNYWPNVNEFTIYFWQSLENSVSVDFGDGTEPQTSPNKTAKIVHSYAQNGTYVISFSVSSGNTFYLGNTSNTNLFYETTQFSSSPHARGIVEMYFGNGCTNAYGYAGYENLRQLCLGTTLTKLPTLRYSTRLKSLTLPNTISTLKSESFFNCFEITNISLSKNIGTISSEDVFYACKKLRHIELPPQLTTISGTNMFFNNISLKNIVFPDSVTTIKGNYFLNRCRSLTEIKFPENLTTLSGSQFFNYASSIREIKIPDNASGEISVGDCINLERIEAPDGVYLVGYNNNCPKLRNFLPFKYRYDISTTRLSGCSSVSSVTMPSGVTTISNALFREYDSLKEIHFNNELTSIGTSAFSKTALVEVQLPNSLTTIGNYAFSENYYLKSLVLPDGLNSIGTYAFYRCQSLSSVTIGNSLEAINDNAFNGCSSLKNVYVPGNVLSAKTSCFGGCVGMNSLTFGEGTEFIGSSAFSTCQNVTVIDLPSTIKSISGYAFAYCSKLESFIIRALEPPTILSTTFNNINSNAIIYVPEESLDKYKNATNWTAQASKIQPLSS